MIFFRNVWYEVGGRSILEDINLDVPEHKITCILGLSGAGKTTVLRMLMGLLRPTRGSIIMRDHDITKIDERGMNELRKKMGMVFQYGALFDSMTVHENVAFGLQRHTKMSAAEIDHIVQERLEGVGLSGIDHLLPSELSGGMRKRVSMARALALSPEVILYDEPTSGLDPISSRAINNLIVQLRERYRVTSVIVSHEIPAALEMADQIALLLYRRFIAIDTPENLRAHGDATVQQFISGSVEGPIQFE